MNEKYLIKLKNYISLLDESLPGDEWINNYGMVTDHNKDLIAVDIGDKTVRLMPGPEFAPFLYRGQNKDDGTCFAGCFREPFLSAQGPDAVQYAINWMKAYEFLFIVYQHPAIEDLQSAFVGGYRFEIDSVALLQHYGFSTQYLDFTRDEQIARFFAYCIYKEKDDSWIPISNFNGYKPILYKISIKSLHQSVAGNMEVIGFQGLKRPDKQKAFCLASTQKYDLNKLPHVTIQALPPEPKEAERIFEKFEGGKKLFPDEIIARKAFAIRKDKLITPEVIEFYCEMNHLRLQEVIELKCKIKEYGYPIGNKNLSLTSQERKQLLDAWTPEKELLNKRIGIRYCADNNALCNK